MSHQEPTEEELRAAMEEQMRNVTVQDVLLQSVATLVNLGGRRLGLGPGGESERDLEQARIAIEATRALVPLLSGEEATAVKQALSQLQMAYAREAQAGAPEGGEEPPGDQPAPGGPPVGGAQPQGAGGSAREEAERAKARSKIWTPPGT